MLFTSGTAKTDRLPHPFLSPSFTSAFRAEQVIYRGPGEISLMDSFLWVGIEPSGLLKSYLVLVKLCMWDHLTPAEL